ncbi:MAG TPA: preprotein translocase subunit SecE [Bacilli bacterium]|nr:preprotein translocase subunit SecE [Bacilli bacterium]
MVKDKAKKPLKKAVAKEKKTSWFKTFKLELSKVKWPEAKEVIKYSLATIIFCLFLIAFFMLLDLVSSLIKGMFS